ncbi:PEBP-like protein [Pholiota conissans]|uniref:PEBP-like protein n=1 Tax=Pholiota conissans TaxID=109636 RepID=A0A9P5Z294_9AGAR|nr:PEBP-like protein [Pholiota conissans]
MDALSNVTTAFSMAQIVPDVINSFDPIALINITFTDSVTMDAVDVDPGVLLTMEQTADEPTFFIDTSQSDPDLRQAVNGTFVLVIVDPDAPTPQMPNVSQFLHFIGGNFMADPTSGLLSNSSAALLDFFSPTPPVGSDPHRYVVLVFNQPDDFDTAAPVFVNASTPRTNFSVSDFALETNLGSPIAGNYFLVGPDDSDASTSSVSASDPATATDTPTSLPDPGTASLPIPTPTPPPVTAASTPNLPADTSFAPSAASPTSAGISVKILDKFVTGLAIITGVLATYSSL